MYLKDKPKIPKLSDRASAHLDMIRAIAAILVLVGHARALFLVDFDEVQSPTIFTKLFYAVTGLGHQAVMVFFVLSGFLITRSIRQNITRGWSWRTYSANRLIRLYVVLVPAIAIGACLDLAGIYYFGTSGIYGGNNYALIIKDAVGNSLSLRDAFINLAFLQGIAGPTFGSNGPLWSLSYEFWYYVLFPLLIIPVFTRSSKSSKLISIALAVVIAFLIKGPILTYFSIWMLGATIAFIPPFTATKATALTCLSAAILIACILISRMRSQMSFGNDLLVAVSFSMFILGLINLGDRKLSNTYERAAKSLSSVSYTLYLVHLPLLVILNAFLIGQDKRWMPALSTISIVAFLCVASISYAYLIAFFTEYRTETIRQKLGTFPRQPPTMELTDVKV